MHITKQRGRFRTSQTRCALAGVPAPNSDGLTEPDPQEEPSTPSVHGYPASRSTDPRTRNFYLANGNRVLRKYGNQTGKTWQENPMDLLHWFIEQTPGWRKNTFKASRYGLLYLLQKQGAPRELLDGIRQTPYRAEYRTPAPRGTRKDPGRVKRFPPEDLQRYLDFLQNRPSHRGMFDEILWRFLQWNPQVGLRPSEPGDAQIARLDPQGPEVLVIRNRKVNEQRGNGTHRVLEIPPQVLEQGRALLEERDRLLASGLTWKEIQNGMMMRMNQVRHELGGRTYTLYSTRHQFVANAKASHWPPGMLADAMGHRSTNTAQSHYGRRTAGRPAGWHGPVHAQGIQVNGQPQAAETVENSAPQATPEATKSLRQEARKDER
ncbi:hypothetical protein AB4090_05040 [Acidithiobacillus sp. IBUN Pt1247-S3]|uniref:hypothetical protein n=1 Tax=Acidithiobacillus sp. IBUN Pt1247-S3 TaxID=3166642 RepID=UPI0034E49AB4